MANWLRKTRRAKPIGKLWTYRFIQRYPKLKTRFNRVYDFQRALCEDPELIGVQFQLVQNIQAKYSMVDGDFYNFDETGFSIGQIEPGMVITRADQRGRVKAIQPGNREQVIAIICINGKGGDMPPFLAIQGLHHLANWYSKTDLPHDWVIKTTNNRQRNNETGLE